MKLLLFECELNQVVRKHRDGGLVAEKSTVLRVDFAQITESNVYCMCVTVSEVRLLQVCVVSPDIRVKNGEAKLNKDHNLEWTIVLAPGQHRDLTVKYTVEHPASESVSFKST